MLPQAGLEGDRIVEAGTPEGAHDRRQPKETVMTELQPSQRRSFTARTIFGLLLAIVMVAAFATAGSAENTGNPRSGELHVTKECSQYTGLAGGFCTITGSNLNAIDAGMKVIYASAADFTTLTLDSDLVLAGPGNNDAYGHVVLDLSTGLGTLRFTGGTGRFSGFQADVNVTCAATCAWDGSYSFTPPGHDN
jgi:hypothetical protein